MSYNQHQQGFNQTPGGVPHGGMPTFPNVPVGESMQPYLPIMAAKIYMDMAERGTAYTKYMAGLYSANGYHNEVFEEIIVMVADFADYSMSTYMRSFNEVIDSVVQDCNSMLLDSHHRNNPQKIPVPLTEAEKNRYRAAKSKLDALRMKISEFLKHKVPDMNNQQYQQPYQQPQQQQQNWNNQPPQSNWMQPQQQQMSPQQQQQLAWQQQQLQQQQYQQQMQMQQQPQYQPPQHRTPYNGGRPNQPGSSDFAQRVAQRVAAGQQQGGYNPHQQFQQPYQQQGTWQQPMSPQQQWQQQQWQQQQAFQQQQMQQNQFGFNPNQQQHPGQFGFNPQQAAPPMQHQQPTRSILTGGGYNPMPMVDEEKLSNKPQDNTDPFASNASIMHGQRTTPNNSAINLPDGNNQASSKSFTPGASYSQPTQPIPPTSTPEERKYERKVRAKADDLGLPEDASLSYLEEEITRREPQNGFISPKNAYSEAKNMAHVQPVQGHYGAPKQDALADENIEVFTTSDDYSHDSFAAKVLAETAAKSNGRLVKQENGRYEWMSYTNIQAFEAQYPGVNIDEVDVARFKQSPPYEFAQLNMKGEWVVEAKFYKQITQKGWFASAAIYPVYSCVGYYVVSDKGVITDFFSRPKTAVEENNVDYDAHDDRRFFEALSPKDLKQDANDARMIQAFANLQVSQKVSEVIEEVEQQAGVLSGDNAALIINKTIEFEHTVNGNILEDDYYLIAKREMNNAMSDIEYDTADVSYRYKHVYMYPWVATSDDDIEALRKLRYKEDYTEIAKVLVDLSELESIPANWFNRLNDVATRYVNDVIATQFPLLDKEFFFIRSFVLDINDAIEEMTTLGYGEAFCKTAARLTRTLLYVWDNTNPVFSDHLDLEQDEDDNVDLSSKISAAGFGIVRDVTVIPLHSRCMPLYSEKDKCLLTEHGFSKLWEIAKERMENRDPRVTEVIIVTSDNRHMYISETAVDGVFAITKKSILA